MNSVTVDLVRRVEEISTNAWPPLKRVIHDGWLLGLTGKHADQRTNSVIPLHLGSLSLEEKIDYCEAFYRKAGQRPLFKYSPAAKPLDLDRLLLDRGYEIKSPTVVQIVDLGHFGESPAGSLKVEWDQEPGAWIERHGWMRDLPAQRLEVRRRILGRTSGSLLLAYIQNDSGTICCGRGVMEEDWVGLFELVTRPDHLRQGLARELLRDLLAKAAGMGAVKAYLQVEEDNLPALNLYADFGFEEVFRYFYLSGPE